MKIRRISIFTEFLVRRISVFTEFPDHRISVFTEYVKSAFIANIT